MKTKSRHPRKSNKTRSKSRTVNKRKHHKRRKLTRKNGAGFLPTLKHRFRSDAMTKFRTDRIFWKNSSENALRATGVIATLIKLWHSNKNQNIEGATPTYELPYSITRMMHKEYNLMFGKDGHTSGLTFVKMAYIPKKAIDFLNSKNDAPNSSFDIYVFIFKDGYNNFIIVRLYHDIGGLMSSFRIQSGNLFYDYSVFPIKNSNDLKEAGLVLKENNNALKNVNVRDIDENIEYKGVVLYTPKTKSDDFYKELQMCDPSTPNDATKALTPKKNLLSRIGFVRDAFDRGNQQANMINGVNGNYNIFNPNPVSVVVLTDLFGAFLGVIGTFKG